MRGLACWGKAFCLKLLLLDGQSDQFSRSMIVQLVLIGIFESCPAWHLSFKSQDCLSVAPSGLYKSVVQPSTRRSKYGSSLRKQYNLYCKPSIALQTASERRLETLLKVSGTTLLAGCHKPEEPEHFEQTKGNLQMLPGRLAYLSGLQDNQNWRSYSWKYFESAQSLVYTRLRLPVLALPSPWLQEAFYVGFRPCWAAVQYFICHQLQRRGGIFISWSLQGTMFWIFSIG